MKTHDLSLPLCLSNSRLPRESNPSPRPIPRPRPRPRPSPPRPRMGLSRMGLPRDRHRSGIHSSISCSFPSLGVLLTWFCSGNYCLEAALSDWPLKMYGVFCGSAPLHPLFLSSFTCFSLSKLVCSWVQALFSKVTPTSLKCARAGWKGLE